MISQRARQLGLCSRRREQARIEPGRRLRSNRDSRRVRMIWIDHDIRVAARRHHRWDDEQSRPALFKPNSSEVLSDRHVVRVVPARRGRRIELFKGDFVGNDGLNDPRRAGRRLAVCVHENLEQANRIPRRVPARAEQAGAFA